MRIAYIIIHDITINDGITKKIAGQIQIWKKLGHEVEIFCSIDKRGNPAIPARQYEIGSNFWRKHFAKDKRLLADINEYNPDIVYFRYNMWNTTLNHIFKKYRTVVEINSNDLGEYYLQFKERCELKTFRRFIANFLLRGLILNKMNGIITVTKELAECRHFTKYNKPITYIPNAVDLNEYQTIKNTKFKDKRIGLFFMGSPNISWHGIDIIEQMADRLPEFDFHVVGIEGDNKHNLFYYGYLQRKKYVKVLKKCHICIGTLALSRKNMSEACPLKVREYIAYGYPVIIGYEDTAFIDKEKPGWVFTFNNDDISLMRLKEFCHKYKDYIVDHESIGDLIGTNVFEAKRLLFLKSCLYEAA